MWLMIYKFIILGIYKHLLSDRKFGLTHNLIATKVMPPLVPQTVNPGLNMEQVYNLKKSIVRDHMLRDAKQ